MSSKVIIVSVALPLVAFFLTLHAALAKDNVITTHAIAIHGTPKHGPDFKHFTYVNPDASKGGEVRLYAPGTFDTLNPFTLKGVPAAGSGVIYDTLLDRALDEASTEYGLVVKSMEVPQDRSWVIFTLRNEARWHDGKPMTVEDVLFSFQTLKTKGHPTYRYYYKNVVKAEKLGDHKVRFSFSGGENRELPVIIGQLPIIPKHYWEGREFEKTTLDPPLGSGPYRIKSFDPGRTITYERVKDYWAEDLPLKRGQHNFDRIRYDYYRDATVALEAFKAGELDIRFENIAKNWATAYDTPAFRKGLIRKVEIQHEIPSGMQAFWFNIRRPMFRDRRVRQALANAFDFEWTNKNLFYDQYTRTKSYFSNSELASNGLPGPEENKILEAFLGKIPEEVFTKEYGPPSTDGTGRIRKNLRRAMKLLNEAGWIVKDRKLVNSKTAEPFLFELLLDDPGHERIALPFAKNLERLGIAVRVRTVDAAQYQKRLEEFDYDMIMEVAGQSLSPGNEQRDYWSSAAAGQPGSRNLIGVKDPVVDALVDLVISAPDRETLIYRTRALDRVLLWGHYVIPQWHLSKFRVAYWDKFQRPRIAPKYSLGFDTWWIDADKAAALAAKKSSLKR